MFKINLCKFLFDFSLKFFVEAEPPWFFLPSNRALKQKLKDLPRPTDFFKFTNFGEGGDQLHLGCSLNSKVEARTEINTSIDASLNKK